jgi:RNA polymerase sigma-70 factor (ECF subfamily)
MLALRPIPNRAASAASESAREHTRSVGAAIGKRSVTALDDLTLDELFAHARENDDDALTLVVERTRPTLYRVALSVTHDPALADDIAQEALVRALTRRFTFLARGPVLAWMKKIALRLALNRRRDHARRRDLLSAHEHTAVAMAGAPFGGHPESVLVDDERRREILRALDALPTRQREVLSLRVIGEFTFAEIARLLSITEANARVTSSQAMQKVKATLLAQGVFPTGGAP